MSSNWLGLGEALTAVVALAVLPAGILTGLFAGLLAGLGVVAVGYLFVLPATAVVLYAMGAFAADPDDWEDGEPPVAESAQDAGAEGTRNGDPLADLRERYARGELGDAEFERKLERLIATEDVDVPDGVSLEDVDRDGEGDAEDEVAFER